MYIYLGRLYTHSYSVFTNGLTRPYSVSYPLLFLCISLFSCFVTLSKLKLVSSYPPWVCGGLLKPTITYSTHFTYYISYTRSPSPFVIYNIHQSIIQFSLYIEFQQYCMYGSFEEVPFEIIHLVYQSHFIHFQYINHTLFTKCIYHTLCSFSVYQSYSAYIVHLSHFVFIFSISIILCSHSASITLRVHISVYLSYSIHIVHLSHFVFIFSISIILYSLSASITLCVHFRYIYYTLFT